MAMHKVNFNRFLSGIPAGDYVFQDETYEEQVQVAARLLSEADAIVIGAGAGLSAAAGLTYGGRQFTDHFGNLLRNMAPCI